MIVTNITGGLGNQMSQFAFGYLLKLKLNTELRLNLNDFNYNNYLKKYASRQFLIDKVFDLNSIYKICENSPYFINKNRILRRIYKYNYILKNRLKYIRQDIYQDSEIYFNQISDNTFLDGLWSAHYTFEYNRDKLKNVFKFKNEFICKFEFYRKKIENENAIAIHIRRGDYILDNHKKLFDICTIEYYEKSVNYINDLVPNPIFYIFSDDLDWCKTALNFIKSDQKIFVDFTNLDMPGEDLYLMSLCKHFIIANSTLSYWGAFLSENVNKIILAPEKWYKIFKSYLLPPGFTGVDF